MQLRQLQGKTTLSVVVIGAGLSGLTTAAVLREAGAEVQVFEAGPQIGGRIRSLRDPITGYTLADLGPTWVWPKFQPVVARWCKTLGLETFEQYNNGDAVIQGCGPELLRQPLPGQDGMVRIVGGPSAMIDALAKRVDASNIRLGTSVSGISNDGPGPISVHLESGETVSAQQVIVSVPLRVAAETLQIPWASPVLLGAMRQTPTWMSTHAKAVALYDRPFWRDAGLAGRIASRTGPLVEVHDHSANRGTPAAVFGFVGWLPEARRRDTEGLMQAILIQLSDCFGPSAAHPIDLVVQDWAMNSHIVTAADIAGPANHPEVGPPILRQPYLDGRVRFAVSETSEVSPGLIEGALAAGERAARGVLACLT